jgi:hypothetical protein
MDRRHARSWSVAARKGDTLVKIVARLCTLVRSHAGGTSPGGACSLLAWPRPSVLGRTSRRGPPTDGPPIYAGASRGVRSGLARRFSAMIHSSESNTSVGATKRARLARHGSNPASSGRPECSPSGPARSGAQGDDRPGRHASLEVLSPSANVGCAALSACCHAADDPASALSPGFRETLAPNHSRAMKCVVCGPGSRRPLRFFADAVRSSIH